MSKSTILYPEMIEFIDEVKEDKKRSNLIKWLLWVAACAVYDVKLPEPRRPGGLQVDLNDPDVMERLRERAAEMRKHVGIKK